MAKYPRFKQYLRTSPWSINANGRTYSIDPWCFESTNIKILDVRLETWGPNNWGWAEDKICQIKGKAKFPDFGFVGGEDRPDKLLKMGEYLIYPIDHEAIEKEFQEGLLHYKSALGDFRDEFDQLSPNEIAEKFGDPHNYGVCRIRGSQWGDGFFRIYVVRDIFEQISSGIAKVGASEINIRFRLWNAFSDGDYYPHHDSESRGALCKRLFLHNEAQDGLEYINHGIIDEIKVEYSYNKIITNDGYLYDDYSKKYLIDSISKIHRNIDFANQRFASIFSKLLFLNIFSLVLAIILAIAR